MRLLKWTGLILVLIAALFGVGAVALVAFVGPNVRGQIEQAVFGPYSDGRDASWHTASGDELIRANNDHFNIALQISRCFPEVNFAWPNTGPPGKVSIAFMLNLQPNGENVWGNTDDPTPPIKLTNFQSTILMLSRSAASARGELAGIASNSHTTMSTFQWLIIIAGALTTILVSIKSMSDGTSNKSLYFSIGILAVVFSSVGTALSSLNSFEGPSEAYVRTERALLQVRQIHLELGFQVAQEKDLCHDFNPEDPNDDRAKKFADLVSRLKDVVGSGSLSVSTTSNASGSNSASSASGH